MRKTYLSLAVSRAMAAEHPIGDPTGGAAYGKREMPAVAVAVAVWEVAAAVEIGFAALTAFEAIAVVSSVVGAVGAVTGNQDLVKIGLVGSIVGGVGSFAANQGWISNESLGISAGNDAATVYKAGEQTAFQKALGINAPADAAKVETTVPTTAPAPAVAPAPAPAVAPAAVSAASSATVSGAIANAVPVPGASAGLFD
jgi:hypothetical protein